MNSQVKLSLRDRTKYLIRDIVEKIDTAESVKERIIEDAEGVLKSIAIGATPRAVAGAIVYFVANKYVKISQHDVALLANVTEVTLRHNYKRIVQALTNTKTLKVVEIFKSIQGEGPHIGQVATFVRLAGCNLRCEGCDTKYAQYEGSDIAIAEIIKKIDNNLGLVITGGEPLLQRESLEELLQYVKPRFVDVETNGTLEPLKYKNLLYIVSPKVGSLKPKASYVLNEKMYAFATTYKNRVVFKFVVDNIDDVKKVEDWVSLYKIVPCRIWLMPMSHNGEAENLVKYKIVAEEAISRNWNFSPRLHRLLWGSKRGV